MKKIITLILLITFIFKSNGQVTEVTPISSSGKSKAIPIRAYKTPMNVYAKFSFSQFIYKGADIGVSGEIKKLVFQVDGNPTLDGSWKHWKVGLSHITEDQFKSKSTSTYSPPRYVSYMNTVNVFDGDIVYDSTEQTVTINLTTPFQYDKSKNLLVEVIDKSPGAYTADIYFKTKEYSSKVMSINDSSSKDVKWSYYGESKANTKVPVVTITIDTSVTGTPTEAVEKKVNTSNLYCGSSTTSDAPAKYYDYDGSNSWLTMLYKAKKIGASGKINKISFFASCRVSDNCEYSSAKNQKVYMKEVDYSTHTNTAEPDLSTYKLVYDGSVKWKSGISIEDSETVITLDTPFEYSGNKTLAIHYVNENGGKLDATYIGGCSEFPYFLWDGEKGDVLSESFGPYTNPSGNTVNKPKNGVGEIERYLPVMRLYFGDMVVEDDLDIAKSKIEIVSSTKEVLADGVASSTITVILYNPKGDHLDYDGQEIRLTTTLGNLGDGFKDDKGNYSFYIVSNTEGVADITGTFEGTAINDSVEVEFTKKPSTIKPNPSTPNPSEPNISINEGFSPNGDGKNDMWIIIPNILQKYPENSVQVFNRHGNLVYKAVPYKNDWDGVSNGKITVSKEQKVPVGPYYYIFDTGNEGTKDGWIYINY